MTWWALKQVRVENDVEHWLPTNASEIEVLEWARRQFSSEERLFVSWEGSSLGDPRADTLRKKLEPVRDKDGVPRGGLPQIASVVDPHELLLAMQQNDVAPQEAVRRLEGVILGAGPLRVRLTEAGRSRLRRLQLELPEAAQRDLGLPLKVRDSNPDLATTALIPGIADESGQVSDASAPAVLSPTGDLQEDSVEHDLTLTWRGIGVGTQQTLQVVEWLTNHRGINDVADVPLVDRCFFVPGAPVALSVTLSEAGLADRTETIRLIRQAAVAAGIPESDLNLAGSAVANTELDRAVSHAAWNDAFPWTQLHRRSVMLTSMLAAAALAFVLLQSLRLAAVVVFASVFSTYLSLALAPATGGSMTMLLAVMPSLLMVIALSCGIRVACCWKQAAATNPRTAAVEACRAETWPCLLATLTVAIGLASLCTSSLVPIREFGLYAALGTMLSCVIVIYGVPALLLFWKGQPPAMEEFEHPGWRWLGRKLLQRPGLQALAILAVSGAISCGLVHTRTDAKVIRYFADSTPIVQDYWSLEGHLAGTTPVETIVRFDAAAQDEANIFDRMELVRAIQEQLRQHPEITGCIALADFQPIADPPEDGASMLTNSRYQKRANLLQDRIRSGEMEGSAAFYSLADKGDEHHQSGDELWRISAQVRTLSDTALSNVLRDVNEISQDVLRFQPGAHHVVTGALPIVLRTQQAVLDGLIRSALITVGLVLLVSTVQLRSIGAGLIAMMPNVVPITVVLGLSAWLGMSIDIGTMIAAPIALGMSIHGTLNYVSAFRQRMIEGQSRDQAVVSALMRSGPALLQSSLLAAVGLLMLVAAELPVIGRFGWLMTAMTGATLLGNVILLPQLLASPLGRLFTSPIETPSASQDGDSSAGSKSSKQSPVPPLESAA